MQDDSLGSSPSKCNPAPKVIPQRRFAPAQALLLVFLFLLVEFVRNETSPFFECSVYISFSFFFLRLRRKHCTHLYPSRCHCVSGLSRPATGSRCVREIFCGQPSTTVDADSFFFFSFYFFFSSTTHCYKVAIIDHVSLWKTFPILIVITIITIIQILIMALNRPHIETWRRRQQNFTPISNSISSGIPGDLPFLWIPHKQISPP